MEWLHVFTIILSSTGLFLWSRRESRSDMRAMEANMKSMENRTANIIEAIQKNMRDFHGRLCNLEARWHRFPEKEEKGTEK